MRFPGKYRLKSTRLIENEYICSLLLVFQIIKLYNNEFTFRRHRSKF